MPQWCWRAAPEPAAPAALFKGQLAAALRHGDRAISERAAAIHAALRASQLRPAPVMGAEKGHRPLITQR